MLIMILAHTSANIMLLHNTISRDYIVINWYISLIYLIFIILEATII